jgi:hypothetical protein
MTRRSLVGVVALIAALGATLAAWAGNGTPINAASANPLTLAVLGDVPYGDAQLAAFPEWVAAINGDPQTDLVVHLGDIKSGSTRCDDAYYDTIAGLFATFEDPLVYTPGDNEWTDCHRLNNGGYNPLERLAKLRETFFADPGTTLGGRAKQVLSQPGYPENVLWMQSKAVFSAIHVVGSNNSLAPWTGNTAPTAAQLEEANERIDATLTWINQAFDTAEEEGAHGVVLMMQADTFELDNENLVGFADILELVEGRAADFDKPVLLLQGDSHSFVHDAPLTGAPNVTRIVVEGAATAHEWLKLDVDPHSPELFSWERVDL